MSFGIFTQCDHGPRLLHALSQAVRRPEKCRESACELAQAISLIGLYPIRFKLRYVRASYGITIENPNNYEKVLIQALNKSKSAAGATVAVGAESVESGSVGIATQGATAVEARAGANAGAGAGAGQSLLTSTQFADRILTNGEPLLNAYRNGRAYRYGWLMTLRHPLRSASSFYRGMEVSVDDLKVILNEGLLTSKKLLFNEPVIDVSVTPKLAMDYIGGSAIHVPGNKKLQILIEFKPTLKVKPGMHWEEGHLAVQGDVAPESIRRIYIFDPSKADSALPFEEFTRDQLQRIISTP